MIRKHILLLGWSAVVMALAACNQGSAPEPRLEPTRTLAPRPTQASAQAEAGAAATAATATPKPVAVTGLRVENVAELQPAFVIDQPPPQHIYAVASDRLTLYNTRSFEVLDATTLDTKARTEVQLKDRGEAGFWYAASPNGRFGAIMQLDGTVDVYDLDTSRVVTSTSVSPPSFEVASDIALNEDGSELVVVSQGQMQRIALGDPGAATDGPELPVATQAIRFSEDASRLAATQATGDIVIVNTLTASLPITLTPAFSQTTVERLNFSPNGRLFGASDREVLRVWEITDSGAELKHTFGNLEGSVEPVFDRSGRYMAAIDGPSVYLYDLQADEAKGEFRLSGNVPVWSANFDPQSEKLFIAGSGDIASFSVQDVRPLESSTRPPVTRATFSPAGQSLATWSSTYQSADVAVINVARQEAESRLAHDAPVRWVSYSPGGQYLATLTFEGALRIWRGDERVLDIAAPESNSLRAILCFSSDDSQLAYLDGQRVIVHDIASDRVAGDFALPFEPKALSVCNNELRYIAASDGKSIELINLDGRAVETLSDAGANLQDVGALYLSRDSRRLASLSPSELLIWDVEGGKVLQKIGLQREPLLGAFNPSGDKFALNFGDDVDVIDLGTGEVTSLDLPKGSSVSMLFPQDPRLIVTTSMIPTAETAARPLDQRTFVTGALSIWDAQTGELVRQIDTDEPIFSAAISDDGAQIAASSRQNALAVWEVK
jgi:WD40 repeat protein